MVTCAEDILTEFNIKTESIEETEVQIEPEYIELYNQITYMPVNINIITKKCKTNISKISQQLLMMELKGYIKSMPGNEYVRV